MENHHIDELLPGYALGSLDEEDNREVLQHLTGCERCQRELIAYQEVVEHLPFAVKEFDPAPSLKSSILEKVGAQTDRLPSTPAPTATWWSGLAAFFRRNSLAWGLTSLALILFLGTSTLLLWGQLQAQVRPRSMQIFVLQATERNPQAEAVLVLDGEGVEGNLTVDGLPALPEEQQYQLWLTAGEQRTDAGVFSVEEGGYGKLHIDVPEGISNYSGIGITIEPAGGSSVPTGEKVLGLDL